MPANETPPDEGAESRLNQQATLNLAAADPADFDQRYAGSKHYTDEEIAAIVKKQEASTRSRKTEYIIDHSLPIGDGRNGTRWVTAGNTRANDPRDERAFRMFALDQGMADQDEAYSPTMESTEAMYLSVEYMNHAIQQTEQLDPEIAGQLAMAERYLAMYPELAVTTRNGFGFAGITEQLAASMIGMDLTEFAERADSFIASTDVGDQFYDQFGKTLDPGTKDIITIQLAGISSKEQQHMFGLMAAYLDARPLITMEDQLNFADYVAQKTSSIYASENDQSFWGKFGRVGAHVFTNPANFLQDEILGSVWTSATDSADAWYRNELTLEETIAISSGMEVGTTGWATFTGLAGMGVDIFIDPTNMLLAGLSGYKAAKTVAIIDDFARTASRGSNARLVLKQLIPFYGKKAAIAAGLPTGVRGRSARIAWTMLAKTQDGLLDVAKEKGVYDAIFKSNSYAGIIEQLPGLKKAPGGLVERLLAQDSVEKVEALYRAAVKGALFDPSSEAHKALATLRNVTDADLDRVLSEGISNGLLNAGDIVGAGTNKVVHNVPIVLASDADEAAVAARRAEAIAKGIDVDSIDNAVAAASGKIIPRAENAGEAVQVLDEAARASAISAGEIQLGRAGKTLDELNEISTEAGNGVRLWNNTSEGVTSIVAYIDDGGVARSVGSIVGDAENGISIGVATSHEGKGLGQALIKASGFTAEELQSGIGSISEAGAGVANKALGSAAKISHTGQLADPFAEGTVTFIRSGEATLVQASPGSDRYNEIVKWVAGNTKYKNSGLKADGTIRADALRAYMRANSVDAVQMNGTVIFQNIDEMRDAGKLVTTTGGEAASTAVKEARLKKTNAHFDWKVNQPKADSNHKWIISDINVKVRTPQEDYKFWHNSYGVFGGTKYSDANFLQRRMRGLHAKVFISDIPSKISTGFKNRVEGVQDLKRLLMQMGVDPDLVARSMDSYIADPSRANVMNIIKAGADDIGDPEITLGLMRFFDKSVDELEYAVINGSEQLTEGVRADGTRGLQPLLSVQTSDYLQLPDSRALSAHFRRIKRATNRKGGAIGRMRNRGWGNIKKERQHLLDGFEKKLGANPEAQAAFQSMSQDEKWAIAYAVVRPKGAQGPDLGDGLGYAAQFGQTMNEQWQRFRHGFSAAMLAWRPIGWMGNEILDNAWRASMAGGLSFFTHPFQSYTAIKDAKRIDAMIEGRAAYLVASSTIRAAVREAKTPSAMLDEVAKVIPDIRKYIDDIADTGDAAADLVNQEKRIKQFLNNEIITSTDTIAVLDEPLAAALYKQRRGARASQKYKLGRGKDGELFDPDWGEIELTGMEREFAAEIASGSARHQWTAGAYRDPETLREYSRAWWSVMSRDIRDPAIKAYLEQYAHLATGGTDANRAARSFVNGQAYDKMKEPITNMARAAGMNVDNLNDLELVEWYFKMKIDPYVRDSFGAILNAENAQTLARGKGVVEIGGELHVLDLDDPTSVWNIVEAANGTTTRLPESVVGVVHPRGVFGYGKEADGWKTPLKSYNQWALNKFGHELPAALQRRPAFLRGFERYKSQYLAMGMTDEAATIVAKEKAVKLINTTFFFVEAQTPFLKSMNSIFPFFAAQWEIVRAWTWNIPTLGSYAGIGHARMLRTFDHVFTSLKRNGLLQPNYDREGNVDSWNLQFASDPHTDNAVGRALSIGGHAMLMAPALFVEQLAEIFTEVRGTRQDFDLTGDEINFKFNHPYEFFGKGGGVIPTARMQVGLNPLHAVSASKLRDSLPFTTTSETSTLEEDQNLALYIAENEINDPTSFLQLNGQRLLDADVVTPDELGRLKAGTMGLTEIELPEGLDLVLPGTSLIGRMVDEVFFPYGQTDSLEEGMSGYVPKAVKNLALSIGLLINNGDIDGLSAWNPAYIIGPSGRAGMGTAYNDAMIMLEMQTGILTRRGEVAEQLADAEPESTEANELETELHRIDDTITREVVQSAASRAFMQTLYSVMMPFNPKMPTEAQTLRSYYYDAKTTAEQWSDGKPMVMPYDGRPAAEAFDMVAAWASDPTGSAAKREFLEQGGGKSSILAAIAPRSYWGPSGIPVQSKDMQDYFANVDAGKIQPLPLDVLQYKIRSMQIREEKEMVIIERYGNTPEAQVAAMTSDNAGWTELTEEFDHRWRALDMEDELMNDGAYAEWALGHADTYVDFVANETLEQIDAVNVALDVIDLELFPDDPAAAKSISGQLTGIASGLRESVEAYQDERYADWEVAPRQAILNEYYDKMADYYDAMSVQYDKVAEADTEEEKSAAYSAAARWRRENDAPIVVDGYAYASPESYSWGSKSVEKKEAIVNSKLDSRMEWLSEGDIDHIIELYPNAAQYLPVSQEARNIFDWKANVEADIALRYRIDGPEAGANLTKLNDRLEKEFVSRLTAAEEFGVLEGLQNYPIENIKKFGALPVQLEWLIGPSIAIHRELKMRDKSPLTNDGKELQRRMFTFVQERFDANPQERDAFIRWGIDIFQETTIEGIVAQMLGNYRGDLS